MVDHLPHYPKVKGSTPSTGKEKKWRDIKYVLLNESLTGPFLPGLMSTPGGRPVGCLDLALMRFWRATIGSTGRLEDWELSL
jgi:hypothetical protein